MRVPGPCFVCFRGRKFPPDSCLTEMAAARGRCVFAYMDAGPAYRRVKYMAEKPFTSRVSTECSIK